ncbi:MAG: hypothetical protein HYX38_15930 [Rhodospirillales bacterium]|nr:hypothetical protein [Rhodospirillales bacterium]
MYTVDSHDRLEELKDFPLQSGGAPTPLVLADDNEMVLAYLLHPTCEEVAIVEFDGVTAHYLGVPNDEAIRGHALFERGLNSGRAYEVRDSSWIRALERMNRVHPKHHAALYSHCRHFIVTFHDTTLECVANGIRRITRLPYIDRVRLIDEMQRRLPRV